MPIDVGALGGVVLRASLDQLGSLVLEDADDLSGGSADGVVDVAATLVQASLACAQDRVSWGKAQETLPVSMSNESCACARTLARVALMGGPEAAARVVWGLCGGDAMQLFAARAVWVAGPAGLAIWGGTSRRSELTGWESSVEVEGWDGVLERLGEAGL